MQNICNNIDISEVNSLGKIKTEINRMSLEELEVAKKECTEILSTINSRIKAIKPRTKRKETLVMEDKVSQASDPIYSRGEINRLVGYFFDKGDISMAAICIFGFNNGNRIGDIIKLRVGKILDDSGEIKPSIYIEEEKNRYRRTLYFNETTSKALKLLMKTQNKTVNDYLFTSNGNNRQYIMANDLTCTNSIVRIQKHITYEAVRGKIQTACKAIGMEGHFATHTLRSTCLNFVAKENTDLFKDRMLGDMVACAFAGHKNLSTTERFYLSLSEKERKQVHNKLNLGKEALDDYLNK